MLEGFYLTDLEVELVFERQLKVDPSSAGAMLRGTFGSALRRSVCLDPGQRCSDCTTKESCAYQKIFSPITTTGSERLSKNRDVPGTGKPRGESRACMEHDKEGARSVGIESEACAQFCVACGLL